MQGLGDRTHIAGGCRRGSPRALPDTQQARKNRQRPATVRSTPTLGPFSTGGKNAISQSHALESKPRLQSNWEALQLKSQPTSAFSLDWALPFSFRDTCSIETADSKRNDPSSTRIAIRRGDISMVIILQISSFTCAMHAHPVKASEKRTIGFTSVLFSPETWLRISEVDMF